MEPIQRSHGNHPEKPVIIYPTTGFFIIKKIINTIQKL